MKKHWFLFFVILFFLIELFLHFYVNILFFKKDKENWFPQKGFVYVPYVEYMSKFREVADRDCVRKTYEKYPDSGKEIWFMGGSAMLGIGSSSWEKTIPSVFSKKFEGNYRILNYGQHGYVINQERILFEELLKTATPSIVVFFDGVNEIMPSVIGYPAVYTQLKNIFRFGHSNDIVILKKKPIKSIYLIENLIQSLFSLGRFTEDKYDYNPFNFKKNSGDKVGAQAIMDNYIYNVKLIETIAKEKNIKVYFFWQPIIFYKNMTLKESELNKTINTDAYQEEWMNLYSLVKNNSFLKKKG